jgi:hypothetical protein
MLPDSGSPPPGCPQERTGTDESRCVTGIRWDVTTSNQQSLILIIPSSLIETRVLSYEEFIEAPSTFAHRHDAFKDVFLEKNWL